MKICAVTMVHKDHWALSQWYAHHARHLGAANLYVLAHGPDPRVAEICPGASVVTVPRDGLEHFDRRRGAAMNGFQAGLLEFYDWVIRTDADELICYDPARYESLVQAMSRNGDAPVLTALGFDLVERPGEAALVAGPVLGQRRHLAFSGHYSKAFAVRRAMPLVLHGVRVPPRRLADFPFTLPRGLYLAHLKYANLSVLNEVNLTRMQVGGSGEPGVPGTGWSEADADAAAFLKRFEEKAFLPWAVAESRAYETLAVKPARLEKQSVVKTRALKFDFRTTSPDDFLTL